MSTEGNHKGSRADLLGALQDLQNRHKIFIGDGSGFVILGPEIDGKRESVALIYEDDDSSLRTAFAVAECLDNRMRRGCL